MPIQGVVEDQFLLAAWPRARDVFYNMLYYTVLYYTVLYYTVP